MNFSNQAALKAATRKAIKYCEENGKTPIKVSFHKLTYEVDHKLSSEEIEAIKSSGMAVDENPVSRK
jgi:hypothetical protein